MKTFADKLKDWKAHRTDAEAASELGVNRRTFENWIAGRNEPAAFAKRAIEATIEPKSKPKRSCAQRRNSHRIKP